MAWVPRKCVVVPIDFSDPSLEAVDHALELVDEPAHIHVIHVLPILAAAEPGVIWETIDDQSRCDHAREALASRLGDTPIVEGNIHVRLGDPGHEIAEFAEQIKSELIILPSHGRTGLRRMLIGSVAERVVRLAHCPVLVLRH